jgi:YfiH family protein
MMRARPERAMDESWVLPDWPAPPRVRAVTTTRAGGVSTGPWVSMNPADHVGDAGSAVAVNRQRLVTRLALPLAPCWLTQVHGTRVVESTGALESIEADAVVARAPGSVCTVLTADCLPVLFCDQAGREVAAAHAGWRGLAAGVLEQTVARMQAPGEELLAWLGPAISADAYVVGEEVRSAFIGRDAPAAEAFRPAAGGGWHADLYALARQRLGSCGVTAVYGGNFCSYRDREHFFSYRRDGITGRMASLVWLQES